MKITKRSFAVVSVLLAVPLSLSTRALNARDAVSTFLPSRRLRPLNSNAKIPVVRDIGTACR